MNTYALIVAAGQAVRYGGDRPKQFVEVCGRPLLSWTISRFEQAESIDGIIVVVSEQYAGATAGTVIDPFHFLKVRKIVFGGETRQASVANGLAALPGGIDWVAIHDGARPLVLPEDIDRVVAKAKSGTCAMLAAPVTDTVKTVRDGVVVGTMDRDNLWLAQTPQVFRVDLIRAAHLTPSDKSASDDAMLAERCGHTVQIVESSGPNTKVTTPEDLVAVEAFLRREAHA